MPSAGVDAGTKILRAGLPNEATEEKQMSKENEKENDLEGQQDQGGKHGGQQGMPKPAERPGSDQGVVRDQLGQEQPRDTERAQRVSRQDKGGDPPGDKIRR